VPHFPAPSLLVVSTRSQDRSKSIHRDGKPGITSPSDSLSYVEMVVDWSAYEANVVALV
jgi:hypothetical protein